VTSVNFTVHGTPAPQGSKTPWGSEANPNTRPWRAAVAAEAQAAMLNRALLTGPCALTVVFTFARPKGHYRTGRHSGELKPNAPEWCSTKPDLDKLLRAIGDALSGIILRDDAQIAAVAAEKHYGSPAAEITVEEIGP
jgi:Holliday junction resolvase RusA-like endonuclease